MDSSRSAEREKELNTMFSFLSFYVLTIPSCVWELYKPSSSTPATIAVETTATRFKVSVRHTPSLGNPSAGVAIFQR